MSALTVVNAVVHDGVHDEPFEGAVRVEGGTVVAAGPDVAAAPGDRVLDARGRTVVPGLVDAHCHAYGVGLSMFEVDSAPLSYVALAGARRLATVLSRGFTTVRDVAGGDAGLDRAIAEGLVASPRYLWSGPALSQTGGHGDFRPGHLDLCPVRGHNAEVVDGVDPLRVAVRDRLRRGAHVIKIMTSGGVVSLTDPIRVPQYSAEEVRAVCEEADRRGSYVAAHAYSPEAVVHSVRNGVRSVEHGNLLDAASAAEMASHGAYLVPTLAAYDAMDRRGDEVGLTAVQAAKNREVLHSGCRAIEIARDAGVPIGFGTDLMGDLEDDQLRGLALQCEVLGVRGTLRCATTTNAALLRRDDLGRLAPGAAGDLLLLDGDLDAEPSLLWAGPARTTVVQAGRVVPGTGPEA